MSPSPRVILDRSALHGSTFQAFVESRLSDHCRAGKLQVYHPPVFLKETLALYSRKDRRMELLNQVMFSESIGVAGVFRDSVDIWEDELIRDRGPATPYLTSAEEEQLLWTRIKKGVSRANWAAWNATISDRDLEFDKKAAQRRLYSTIRSETAQRIKREAPGSLLSQYSFAEHRNCNLRSLGTTLIATQFDKIDTRHLERRWFEEMDRYPMFTSFIEGILYAGYFAAVRPNDRIDTNSQADVELLTFLNFADIVVSADTRFFRAAFEEIWSIRGKRLMSPTTFLAWCADGM
jgi:hypothetical protein